MTPDRIDQLRRFYARDPLVLDALDALDRVHAVLAEPVRDGEESQAWHRGARHMRDRISKAIQS